LCSAKLSREAEILIAKLDEFAAELARFWAEVAELIPPAAVNGAGSEGADVQAASERQCLLLRQEGALGLPKACPPALEFRFLLGVHYLFGLQTLIEAKTIITSIHFIVSLPRAEPARLLKAAGLGRQGSQKSGKARSRHNIGRHKCSTRGPESNRMCR
jgi:hypothetical protein